MNVNIVWFPFYIGDYLKDTQELSPIEHGMYLKLMLWYYTKVKPIPHNKRYAISGANDASNDNHLLSGCSSSGASSHQLCDELLVEFFLRDGDVWKHKRIDAELSKQADISEKRKSAVAAREKRKAGGNNNPTSNDVSSDISNDNQVMTQSQSQSQDNKKDAKASQKQEQNHGSKKTGSRITHHLGLEEETNGLCPDQWANYTSSKYGWSQDYIQQVFDGFCDYWRGVSGQRGTKLDWYATWRGWCGRQAPERGRQGPVASQGVDGADRAAAVKAAQRVMAERDGEPTPL